MYPYISRFLLENQNKQIACPEERAKVGAEIARVEELAKKSPLFEAVLSDKPESLEHLEKLLLEKGEAHKEEIANTVTEGNDSLLMLAVYKGHYDKALHLMNAGARVDAFNRDNVSVMKLLDARFLRKQGCFIKFLYHALFEAKGKENIKKQSLSELIPDGHCVDVLFMYVSYNFVMDMQSNPALFSYYYAVFKKLFSLNANPVFPDGRNIFHLVRDAINQIDFYVILGLIEVCETHTPKLLSEVNIDTEIFHEILCRIAIEFYLKTLDKINDVYFLSALNIFIDWIKKKKEPQWGGPLSRYETLMTHVHRIEEIRSRQFPQIHQTIYVNFSNLKFTVQYTNSKPINILIIDKNTFYDFGNIYTVPLTLNLEEELINFLNTLKKVKYPPKELDCFVLYSYSAEFRKFIYLFPTNKLTLDMGDTDISPELIDSSANELDIHIKFSSFSNTLKILKQNRNCKCLTMRTSLIGDLEDSYSRTAYKDILQAVINFFEYKKNLTVFAAEEDDFINNITSCVDPIYKNSEEEVSIIDSDQNKQIKTLEKEEILNRIEELFHHLSTCTLLSEFRPSLFYGLDPHVLNKIKECISSNYSITNYELFSNEDIDEFSEEGNALGSALAHFEKRNSAFKPLLNLYNQWIGLLPLDPKFQSSSSNQVLSKVTSLDDDVEMEPEPQEKLKAQVEEPDGKRAKEESIAKDSTKDSKLEKETQMAKDPPSVLEEMEYYAKTLSPTVKEKLLQAMIDLIPKIDEKYRNECCYILANEFLLSRLTEESMAAKILNLIPPPPVAIDRWYKEAQDKLSFIVGVKDHKARLAHRLECRDENSNGVIPRLISSMHTPEQDEDGDAIMDLVPPASYNLSLTGPSIAEFVDYSSKQYLAVVKGKEKCENDLQIMQARLEQMIAEKDAETKRLQEKNAELERLQKRVAELEAINGSIMLQQNIVQPKPLSFLCDMPHKRKAVELTNGEEGKEGSVNTKRVKTHHDA